MAELAGGPTYAPVGGTLAERMPPGFHHVHVQRRLGGAEVYDAAAAFVLGWGLQRGAGLRLPAGCPPPTQGQRVLMRLGPGRLAVRAPVQVVRVLAEPERRGFAYGTLPGHPESGEELFAVERRAGGTWLVVRAYSRPARWFTRLGGPVGRVAQRLITRRYVAAAVAAVRPEAPA